MISRTWGGMATVDIRAIGYRASRHGPAVGAGNELVHDAAACAYESIFGALAGERHGGERQRSAGQLQQRKCRSYFDRRRRTESRAGEHCPRAKAQRRLRALLPAPGSTRLPSDSRSSAVSPWPATGQPDTKPVRSCFPRRANPSIGPGTNGGNGAEIDGRRHNKPAAIVGVLTDEIDAARRGAAQSRLARREISYRYIVRRGHPKSYPLPPSRAFDATAWLRKDRDHTPENGTS